MRVFLLLSTGTTIKIIAIYNIDHVENSYEDTGATKNGGFKSGN